MRELRHKIRHKLVPLIAALSLIIGVVTASLNATGTIANFLNAIGHISDVLDLYDRAQGFFVSRAERMEGANLRVAVAGFVSSGTPEGLGDEIAKGVYTRLEADLAAMTDDLTVLVWGPDKVGRSQGETPLARSNSAAEISHRINANLVVYGAVNQVNGTITVTPEFYIPTIEIVDENSASQASADTEIGQMTGSYSLGRSLQLPATTPKLLVGKDIEEIFPCRVQLLAHFIFGLAYYFSESYDESFTALEHGEQACELDDVAKSVLFVLTGNAAGKANLFGSARTYYARAISLNPESARGHIGLASVEYNEALRIAANRIEGTHHDVLEKLASAKSHYNLALQIQAGLANANLALVSNLDNKAICSSTERIELSQYSEPNTTTKVCFGLGQVEFLAALLDNQPFERAADFFQAVIREYELSKDERIRILAAESHGTLARIYRIDCNTSAAIDEYRLAASIHPLSTRQQLFQKRFEEIQMQQEQGCIKRSPSIGADH